MVEGCQGFQQVSPLRLRLRLSARRPSGGSQHFSKSFRGLAKGVETDCRWWRFVVSSRARSETAEADRLTSEGLKGPKRADLLKCCHVDTSTRRA